MTTGALPCLDAGEIAALLDIATCVRAVEKAFRDHGEGGGGPTAVLGFDIADGSFHVKAAADGRYFAAKVNANFPGNPGRGLPTVQGALLLFDARTGQPLAIMDSMRLTALRTAAASAVAARYLAREDSRRAAIIGCGVQALPHVEALRTVRALDSFLCYDVDGTRAAVLAGSLSGAGLDARVSRSAADAAREADIIVTATTARQPVLGPGDVSPGAFVAAVGADNEHKQEMAPALMARARVVVDLLEQCVRIGDLRGAIAAGTMKPEQVHAELADVIAGKKPGRRDETEIFVFDSTGVALEDVAAASVLYERWLEGRQGGISYRR